MTAHPKLRHAVFLRAAELILNRPGIPWISSLYMACGYSIREADPYDNFMNELFGFVNVQWTPETRVYALLLAAEIAREETP